MPYVWKCLTQQCLRYSLLGTNLIHNITAVTFSVKTVAVCEKRIRMSERIFYFLHTFISILCVRNMFIFVY